MRFWRALPLRYSNKPRHKRETPAASPFPCSQSADDKRLGDRQHLRFAQRFVEGACPRFDAAHAPHFRRVKAVDAAMAAAAQLTKRRLPIWMAGGEVEFSICSSCEKHC